MSLSKPIIKPPLSRERVAGILHGRGISALEKILDDHFGQFKTEEDELILLQCINEWLSDKSILSSIISEIEATPERLDWVQSNSSLNPNGFYRLMLLGGDHFKCRAHIWTDVKFGAEAIHDHKCNFASRVLRGGYRNSLFRESNHLSKSRFLQHQIDAVDPFRKPKQADDSGLILDSIMEFRERSSFVMPSHSLHQLGEVKPYSMTLTIRGPVRPKICRVFVKTEGPIGRPVMGLTKDQVDRLIFQIKSQYVYDSNP